MHPIVLPAPVSPSHVTVPADPCLASKTEKGIASELGSVSSPAPARGCGMMGTQLLGSANSPWTWSRTAESIQRIRLMQQPTWRQKWCCSCKCLEKPWEYPCTGLGQTGSYGKGCGNTWRRRAGLRLGLCFRRTGCIMHIRAWVTPACPWRIKQTRMSLFTSNDFWVVGFSLSLCVILRLGLGICFPFCLRLGLRVEGRCWNTRFFAVFLPLAFLVLFVLSLFVFLFLCVWIAGRCIYFCTQRGEHRCCVLVMLGLINDVRHGLPQKLKRPLVCAYFSIPVFVNSQAEFGNVLQAVINPCSQNGFSWIFRRFKAAKDEFHSVILCPWKFPNP